jgi:hypothetical protein
MSTASAPAAVAAPATTPIKATRGAWLKLEQLLMIGEAFPGQLKTEKATKLLLFLRRENPLKVDHPELGKLDFEIGLPREKGESDLDFSLRGRAYTQFYKAWEDETLAIEFSEKRKKIAVDGLEWLFKNRTKVAPSLQQNDQHTLSLIQAFALTQDDEGNPKDDE